MSDWLFWKTLFPKTAKKQLVLEILVSRTFMPRTEIVLYWQMISYNLEKVNWDIKKDIKNVDLDKSEFWKKKKNQHWWLYCTFVSEISIQWWKTVSILLSIVQELQIND